MVRLLCAWSRCVAERCHRREQSCFGRGAEGSTFRGAKRDNRWAGSAAGAGWCGCSAWRAGIRPGLNQQVKYATAGKSPDSSQHCCDDHASRQAKRQQTDCSGPAAADQAPCLPYRRGGFAGKAAAGVQTEAAQHAGRDTCDQCQSTAAEETLQSLSRPPPAAVFVGEDTPHQAGQKSASNADPQQGSAEPAEQVPAVRLQVRRVSLKTRHD